MKIVLTQDDTAQLIADCLTALGYSVNYDKGVEFHVYEDGTFESHIELVE